MKQDEVNTILNQIIEANIKSEKVFRTAVRDAESDSLKEKLSQYRQERADFIETLRAVIRREDGEPEATDGPVDAVERGWITIKSAMTIERDRTDQVILEECAEQEEETLELYREAIDHSLPLPIKEEIATQHRAIESAYKELNQLAESAVSGRDH